MPRDHEERVVRLQDRLENEPERLHDTDLANARRFIQQHHNDVRWTPERGWLAFDGTRWQPDDMGRIESKAKSTVEKIFDEIINCVSEYGDLDRAVLDGDTQLIGEKAVLKSRAVVELLLALEEFAEDEMGVEFDWTSDSAMSISRSVL